MVIVEIDDKKLYIDERLKINLEKQKERVTKKDYDQVYVVDGEEGSGKSVFAMQIGFFLDPTLNLDRICMTPQQFIKSVTEAKKGECIIYDEAFTGLSSRSSLSEINNLIVSMMMEMRQKNLFVLITLPTFFLLDKYVALFRSRALFHVYERKGRRGFWVCYNKRKKKLLYIRGKKEYSYNGAKSNFRGRFTDYYPISEEEYRNKKKVSLKEKKRTIKTDKYFEERNKLIYILHEEYHNSIYQLETMFKLYDVQLKKSNISEIIRKYSGLKANVSSPKSNI